VQRVLLTAWTRTPTRERRARDGHESTEFSARRERASRRFGDVERIKT
jgi:hypothetical protein